MLTRSGRALLLDRRPFTEAFFDSNAMADSAILVSLVAAVTYVATVFVSAGSFSVTGLFGSVIAGIISWLILGFATWLAATKLFNGSGRPQTMLGLQGLAVLPLLLELFPIGAAIGLVWYLVILVIATREAVSLPTREAAVAVLIGFAIAVVVRLLIGVPFAVFSAIF